MNKQIKILDEVVDWKILEKVYEMDLKSPSFRILSKLSKRHVYQNNFEKLSVKHATQVLSHTVAAGNHTAIRFNAFEDVEEKKIAEATASFFSRMNDLFDRLNAGKLFSRNPNKEVLSASTNILTVLHDAKLSIGVPVVRYKFHLVN